MQPIACGEPQGSILGPLMITVLLNDVDTNLKLWDMILYADDIVMFHAGRTSTDIENSPSSRLEQTFSWFNENNLVINLKKSKTECVLYGTHQKMSGVSGFEVKLHGMKITVSAFYNYLRVIMDKSLSHKTH